MSRRSYLLLALVVSTGMTVWTIAQPPKPSAQVDEESDDDAKERLTAERFRKVLENNPRRGTALDRVYGYHVERGSLDKLVEEYTARTAKNPNDGVAWMTVGLIEAQRGRDAAAVEAFTKAEAALPKSALPGYYLGQVLVLVGRPEDAAAAFERAITRNPARNDLLEMYGALGRVYQRSQKTEKALDVWNRLEQQYPDDTRVQEQIATALVEEGQYAAALPRLEKLGKTVDDKYRQATLKMDAADLKVKLKKTADALVDFEKLLGELNPESWLYRDVRRRIEEVFLKNDDLAGLAKYYESWLEKNPSDVEAVARLAKNLASQGRGPDAQKWLQKGLEVAPGNKALRQALIDQFTFAGDFAAASKQYEAMEKADPNNPDILRDWGKLVIRDTKMPEAERKAAAAAIWKRMLDKKPNDPVATAQVAELTRLGGAVEDAIALYKKAIELGPTQPQYREYLGEYYHTLKRPADAISTWRPIAEGENRTGKNLARLAEVFAGFGYRKEAIDAMAQAITLEKDDFNLLSTYADLLQQEGKNEESLAQLDLAAKFTSNAEEVEQVLTARIKAYSALEKLGDQIDQLQKELSAGMNPTGERYLLLARYLEANKQADAAVAAITTAAEKEPKSIPILTTAARLHETGGNLLAAAEVNRKLALVDRRFRTDYLTAVMKLEQRLGRRDEAMKAGKELIASAPGNPDVYKTYSELCFALGELDEGVDALRRSVRANPGEPGGLTTLANALIDRGRSGEAIELMWRAYDKSTDLEAKLGVVDRLANLYLEANQFDKLIERLERERGEAEKQREGTLALAQAYQSAGDLGTARLQLERLLTENTRDTNLLSQLSQLCEMEGDVGSGLKYQRQLVAAAPQNFDAQVRLAQMLLKTGEGDEAADVWVKQIAEQNEPHRNLQAIDQLISTNRADTALAIIARMLAQKPGNWELLYREGALLAAKGKIDEAATRFQAIVNQKLNDDDLGEALQYERKAAASKKQSDDKKTGKTAPTPRMLAVQAARPKYDPIGSGLQRRLGRVSEIRVATGVESEGYYYRQQPQQAFYSPQDFGEARMAAIGFLYEFARRNDKADEFLKTRKAAKDAPKPDVRVVWDWFYLQSLRNEYADRFDTVLKLSKMTDDPNAAYAFITNVSTRVDPNARYSRRYRRSSDAEQEDKTPPLPPDQLDYLLSVVKQLKSKRPEWVGPDVVGGIALELKRAKRLDEEKAMYAEILSATGTVDKVQTALWAATERGELDTAMMLFKKLETLQGPVKPGTILANLPTRQSWWTLLTVIGKRCDDKKYAEALAVLNTYLTMVRKQNVAAPKAAAAGRRSGQVYQQQGGYNVTLYSKNNNWTNKQITFPYPNEYFDDGCISLLLNTFELYKKVDLLSDLFGHYEKQLTAATNGVERQYLNLILAYLYWWNEEKDTALEHMASAVEAVPTDTGLTFEVASLREQNNENAAALTLIDGITPTDHQTMQKREQIALRLAERTGNLDRARAAAERLFGLRLDADTQMTLATKMHALGLHQLAETVLARATRQAGNKTQTLVRLMTDYQSQGQTEQAVQIARQLLRKTSGAVSANRYDDNDNVRNQAVGVLAQTGQLKDLVERTEGQLKASPKSLQIHQQLLGYYQATGEKEKRKAILLKLIELKPEDGKFRFTAAQQLQQLGDRDAALVQYKEALKRDPTSFQNYYYEIERAFSEANKFEELVGLIDTLDMKKLSNYWQVVNMISPLFEKDRTREVALKLFKKAWKAFPNQRAYLLGELDRRDIWQLPEIYDYMKQAVIPQEDSTEDPWAAIIQRTNSSSNTGQGQLNTIVGQLLKAARRQQRLPELRSEIETVLKQKPTWLAGKALLAVIDIQTGNKEAGKKAWTQIFDDPKADIPAMAKYVLSQELEYYAGIEETVLKTLESGFDEVLKEDDHDFESHPARRLVWWYEHFDRTDDARKLLKKLFNPDVQNDGRYGGGYWEYRQLQNGMSAGRELVRLDDPIAAVQLYTQLLAKKEWFAASDRYYGGQRFDQQIQAGIKAAYKAIKPETLPRVLDTLLTPRPITEANRQALDLMMSVDTETNGQMAVKSVFVSTLKTLTNQPEVRAKVAATIGELSAKQPDDLSIAVTAVVIAGSDAKKSGLKPAVQKLVELVDRQPLEALPKSGKPNSRQRADAVWQIPIWLAARECLAVDDLRPMGEKLGRRALDAAKRQQDPQFAMAILREWSQLDLDRKDPAAAEAKWTAMYELIVPKPTTSKKPASPAVAPVPSVAPAPVAPVKPKPQARIDDGRPTYFAQVKLALSTAVAAPSSGNSIIINTKQFQKVYELAKLSAEQGMTKFSLQIVRDALKGGPPVAAPGDENQRVNRGYRQVTYGGVQYLVEIGNDNESFSVDTGLTNLVAEWKKRNVSAVEIYDVLASSMFLDSRPAEVFVTFDSGRPVGTVYVMSSNNSWTQTTNPPPELGGGSSGDRGLAGVLCGLAIDAKKVDDLQKRLDTRLKQPLGETSARTLQFTLAMKSEDHKAVTDMLKSFEERLAKDTTQQFTGLVSQLAQTALEKPPLTAAAEATIQKLLASGMKTKNSSSVTELAERLISFHLRRSDKPKAIAVLQQIEPQAKLLSASNPSFDQVLGNWQLRCGLVEEALISYGKNADALGARAAGSGSRRRTEPTLGGDFTLLMKGLLELPAAKRYAALKAWTAPTKSRNSLRYYVDSMPKNPPPADFGTITTPLPSDQYVSTMELLIDAAKECDKTTELMTLTDEWLAAKAADAGALRALLLSKTGRASDPAVVKYLDEALQRLTNAKPDDTIRSRYDYESQYGTSFQPTEFLVWKQASTDAAVRTQCEKLGQEMARRVQSNNMTTLHIVRKAQRQFDAARFGDAKALTDATPQRWLPVHNTAGWLAADDTLTTSWSDSATYALFDTPLTGTFEFSADVYMGTWAQSQLGYGGVIFEANDDRTRSSIFPILRVGVDTVTRPTLSAIRKDVFNTFTVRVSPTKVTALINGEVYYEDKAPSLTAPWLTLFSGTGRNPVFRNPTLTGKPEVPAEVNLIANDSLDGWFSHLTTNTMPGRLLRQEREEKGGILTDEDGQTIPDAEKNATYDWAVKGGELLGRKLENPTTDPVPSKIGYCRPMQPGDAIRYEFFYEPGKTHCHPSVGRYVYRLDSDGLKLTWLTLDADAGWSGLRSDNAIPAPGAKKFALKANEWNAASLSYAAGGVVTLTVNGEAVFTGPVQDMRSHYFGFVHFREQTAARVRNVVLTGTWPKTIAPADLAFTTAPTSPTIARIRRELIGEQYFEGDAKDVLASVAKLSPTQRYEALAAWVLPSETRPRIQLATITVPQDVLGVVDRANQPAGERVLIGNKIDGPALQMGAAAKSAGKLDDLISRIEKATVPNPTEPFRAAKEALTVAVRVAQDKPDDVNVLLKSIREAVTKLPLTADSKSRQPSFFAALTACETKSTAAAVLAIAQVLNQNLEDSIVKNVPFDGRDNWMRPYRAVRVRAELTLNGSQRTADPGLKHWAAISDINSWTRSQGFDTPVWSVRDGAFLHLPGHQEDYLILKTPLTGDFEVTCDLYVSGWREAHIRYGGYQFELNHDKKSYKMHTNVRHAGTPTTIQPPLPESKAEMYAFKMTVKDGVMTSSVDGRVLSTERIGPKPDPWLALHAHYHCTGWVKNLKLNGQPTVPASIDLLVQDSLSCWRPHLNPDWIKRGEEMYHAGGKPILTPGQKETRYFPEAVNYYQRPLLEDGTIEYEFYYHPDKAAVFPSLDRLGFEFDETGCKLHWITDGPHEKTGIPFDNVTADPKHRKAEKIPLTPKAWNKAALSVKGDVVTVTVNGVAVYERPIEPTNQRLFGFYHYQDRTEARVRNVVYTGNWAKTPPKSEELLTPK